MINHRKHFYRYDTLMNRVSAGNPSRLNDAAYKAALYILSADVGLFEIARTNVGTSGINFDEIIAAVRHAQVTDSQVTAAMAAYNLFNGGSSSLSLQDLSMCNYETLDVIVTAFYIRKGGRTPVHTRNGEMSVSATREQYGRDLEQSVYRMIELVVDSEEEYSELKI